MKRKIVLIISLLTIICSPYSFADYDKTQLNVWANEAIIATYTFDYKDLLQEQKKIAQYFTSAGWIAYNKALTESKLLELVQENSYFVSAVATNPPKVTVIDAMHWQATMPILVLYENPQHKQQQYLNVTIQFGVAPSGQGVRGLSIMSLQSSVAKPPCECKKE